MTAFDWKPPPSTRSMFGKAKNRFSSRRKPTISRRTAYEMVKSGTPAYVVAQALFGGPEWVPAHYNDKEAAADVQEYVETGTFKHKRWTNMRASDLAPELRRAYKSLPMGSSDDKRRTAVLAAWLGGYKKTKLGMKIKKSYMTALDSTPGMKQRVFETFLKSAARGRDGGKNEYTVLKVGNTAKLVEGRAGLEKVLKNASNALDWTRRERLSSQSDSLMTKAMRQTLLAQRESHNASSLAHKYAIDAARISGQHHAMQYGMGGENLSKATQDLITNMERAGVPEKTRVTIVQELHDKIGDSPGVAILADASSKISMGLTPALDALARQRRWTNPTPEQVNEIYEEYGTTVAIDTHKMKYISTNELSGFRGEDLDALLDKVKTDFTTPRRVIVLGREYPNVKISDSRWDPKSPYFQDTYARQAWRAFKSYGHVAITRGGRSLAKLLIAGAFGYYRGGLTGAAIGASSAILGDVAAM